MLVAGARGGDGAPRARELGDAAVLRRDVDELQVRAAQDRVAEQATALKQLRTQGKDLFEMNETRKVESTGTALYQTTETYGTAMSIEKIIAALKQAEFSSTAEQSNCVSSASKSFEKQISAASKIS